MVGRAGDGDGTDMARLGEGRGKLRARCDIPRAVHPQLPLRMPSSESTWLRFSSLAVAAGEARTVA